MKALGYDKIDIAPPKPSLAWMDKVVIDGTTAYVSGHPAGQGKVPSEVSVEDGYKAAATAMANALQTTRAALGSLDRIERVLRVTGYVNVDTDFHDVSKVIHGASELLHEVFGDAGKHARTAIGTAQLPSNCAAEVELILKVKP
ncbi:MAG: RidA family protein [bacterium]